MSKNGETHRADAVLPDGKIIELQHSRISPEEIRERELFYGEKLVWIFDCRSAYEKGRIELKEKNDNKTFRWKHAKKTIAYTSRKTFLDLGEGNLYELVWMSKDTPCGGRGKLHYSEHIEDMHNQVNTPA
jgi:hypothetical protein